MRFRNSVVIAALLLSSGIALASPVADGAEGSGSGSSASIGGTAGSGGHTVAGFVAALGLSGAASGIVLAFKDHSSREKINAPARAPEISTSGLLSGLILLLGGALVIRGRKEAQVSA